MRATGTEERKNDQLICKIKSSEKNKFFQICRTELKQNPGEVLRGLVENFNKKQANN